MNYNALAPNLHFTEPLYQAPHVLNSNLRKGNSRAVGIGMRCILEVFGMHALSYITNDLTADNFDTRGAEEAIKEHPNGSVLSIFSLPDLLAPLQTKYAAKKAGAAIRAVTTVGCDFGEIQKKIIMPVKERVPNARFVVSAILASENSILANHAVVVAGTTSNTIELIDSKYHERQHLTQEQFFNRWAFADMQATISMAIPQC